MPSKKRALSRFKAVPNQAAVRWSVGQEQRVRRTLAAFGTVEDQPAGRILILHRARGVPRSKLDAALNGLRKEKAIEFVTPVLHDRESGTRQVLTDEIVLRLKQGSPRQRILAALKTEHGLEIGKRNAFEPTQYIVRVPQTSGTQTLEVARSLDQRTDVEFAAPNFLTKIDR